MMDLLQRVYRILKAEGYSDQAPPALDYETPPYTQQAPSEPAQDPELARYYANLEIPYGADVETARQAWKRLLKKYHPDLQGRDEQKRRIANDLTAQLTQAYRAIERAHKDRGRS